nr:gustatory receptor 50.1 [Papilio memnon]
MISDEINEFSSKNQIQSFVSEVLFPLTVMQFVSFSPKFYIRSSFVRPNGILTNFILCLITAVVFVSFGYFSYFHIKGMTSDVTDVLLYVYIFLFFIYALGYLVNAVVVVLQSPINVGLLIRIDVIERNLKIKKIEKRRLVIENWVLCIFVILFHISNSYVQFFYATASCVDISLSVFIVIPWDLNVIYSTIMVRLLRRQTDTWILNLKSLLKATHSSESFQNFHWKAILIAYLNIIDSYTICEKITEITIIYHMIITFVQFIINVQTLIVVMEFMPICNAITIIFQVKSFNVVLILCILWTIKHTILLLLICIECDKLYTSLKNSQVECLATVYENCTNIGRLTCKRLRKEAEKKLQPMIAKGCFTVNLTLPLQIFSIVATYTVVLLQFNFL